MSTGTTMSHATPRVAVLGSINMDLVVRCAVLPSPGQTIAGSSVDEICGGKGANQAVAAARAGGKVAMIGRIGNDGFGARMLVNLHDEQINCRHVQDTAHCPTGVAFICVEDSGQNAIIYVPGANGCVTVADVEAARSAIESADVLLLQLETPVDSVLAAIRIAKAAGVRTILDPAPAPHRCPDELLDVDLICPNESEAAAITGSPVETITQAQAAARTLHERGARHVVITLGGRGALLVDDDTTQLIEPFAIRPVDTTAAGDAFAGALAVAWASGRPLLEAITFASAAGALAASHAGAQPSLPTRDEIEKLWRTRS
jgi:ribokinase